MNNQIFGLALVFSLIGIFAQPAFGQEFTYLNAKIFRQLTTDPNYKLEREKVLEKFNATSSGAWGEFVKGVGVKIDTREKLVALTFDACGGPNSSSFDSLLISYLKQEKIHASLFVTGRWIDANYYSFLKLSKDTLFEIENHGLNHKPCSFKGESVYGIKGTASPQAAYDEIEINAIKIQKITGKKPHFYRSATAYIDEAGVRMASEMGYSVISYDVLSADAMKSLPAERIKSEVLKHIHPGAIVIMHFNHPEWNTGKALHMIIPELKKQGYTFVLLKNSNLLDSTSKIKH